jgi:hypothetical protein
MADYETDAYGWAIQTSAALPERRLEAVDWDSVAEEIEGLDESERSALESNLLQILVRMLSPSISLAWPGVVDQGTQGTCGPIVETSDQTGFPLSTFPKQCQWTVREVVGRAAKA